MNLSDYASHDALSLAALVRQGEITATDLADTAAQAVQAVNDKINAVIGPVAPDLRGTSAGEGAAFAGPVPAQGPRARLRRRLQRHGQPLGARLCSQE